MQAGAELAQLPGYMPGPALHGRLQSRCSVKLERARRARMRRPAPRWCGWKCPCEEGDVPGPDPLDHADPEGRRHLDGRPLGQRLLGGPDAKSQTGIASSCRSWATRNACAPGIHSPAKTVQPMIAARNARRSPTESSASKRTAMPASGEHLRDRRGDRARQFASRRVGDEHLVRHRSTAGASACCAASGKNAGGSACLLCPSIFFAALREGRPGECRRAATARGRTA